MYADEPGRVSLRRYIYWISKIVVRAKPVDGSIDLGSLDAIEAPTLNSLLNDVGHPYRIAIGGPERPPRQARLIPAVHGIVGAK
jgi:hypothetical protein